MKNIYVKKSDGTKVVVSVADEVADEIKKSRQAIWNNEAKALYYYGFSIQSVKTEKLSKFACSKYDPAVMGDVGDEKKIRKIQLMGKLKSLTAEQLLLVKMIFDGATVTQIAEKLGVSKPAISQMRKRIQKKFEEFL